MPGSAQRVACNGAADGALLTFMSDSERLIRFFGGGVDDRGRTHAGILAWDDEQLEHVHDYIQWLFPLPERSGANPSAPVLDPASIATMRSDPEMQARLVSGFERMLAFYGFVLRESEIVEGPDFAPAAARWLTPGDHNHLRITRILRCLRVLGREQEAQQFWWAVAGLYRREPGRITERTFAYWRHAATEPLDSPPQ